MKRRDLLRAALALPLLDLRPPRDDREVAALLWHDSPNDLKAFAGFRRGFSVVDRAAPRLLRAERDAGRAEALVAGARADGAKLLVALGTQAALLTKRISGGLPIVYTAVTNPVASGVVSGWEGSGEAIAGNSNWLDRGEMLRAFRTAIPDLKRLGVVATRGNAVSAAEIAEAERVLVDPAGAVLEKVFLGPEDDLGAALDALLPRVDALWVPIDFALYQDEAVALIAERARRARRPVVSSSERWAGKGALVVLAVDYELLGLRAAAIAIEVLRGRDPSRIPVGRLGSSRLYVDVDAARAIGLEPPLELILRAWKIFGRSRR